VGRSGESSAASVPGTAMPLEEFANDGVGGRAWNSYNQTANSDGPEIAGRPSPIGAGSTVHVYARSATGDLMEFINDDAGGRLWNSYDLTQIADGPTVAADPGAALYGPNVHVYTEAPDGDLVEWANDDAGGRLWNSYDLTQIIGGPTLEGDPTPLVNGSSDRIFARGSNGDLIEYANDDANGRLWNAYDLTEETDGPSIAGDPNPVYDGSVLHVYVQATGGDLIDFVNDNPDTQTWTAFNVTASAGGPTMTGRPSPLVVNNGIDVFVRASSGALTEYANDGANGRAWNAYPISGPTVVGDPSSVQRAGSIYVYAQASGGDLTEFIENGAGQPWQHDDPTEIAEGPGIGGDPAAFVFAGVSLHVYVGAGTQSSAPGGVGVYGLDAGAETSQAIEDDWPIIGDTGALGTQTAPYTGINIGADEQTGADITASGRRVTWLSFWTVSGPVASGTAGAACYTTSCYYSDGYGAGQYVAQTIDSYAASGVSVKPDWVILDPEGYPDDHSGLDDPTLGGTAANWLSFLTGWSQGITSVNTTLQPAYYADQYEYNTFDLGAIQLPAFIAVAFPGPIDILNATTNVAGFIAFGATCPSASEEQTLVSAPWSGSYNTLQFAGSQYCAP
jgi:hypothetical protein